MESAKKPYQNGKMGFFRKNDDVATPKEFYEALNELYRFDFDPCPQNPEFDGLEVPWGQMNFVNPPFSKISKWVRKGVEELRLGKKSVFLISVRTTSKYWWEHLIPNCSRILFLQKCLCFQNYEKPLPVPLCLVFFGFDPFEGHRERKVQIGLKNGEVVDGFIFP